jgi:hypothetical protein
MLTTLKEQKHTERSFSNLKKEMKMTTTVKTAAQAATSFNASVLMRQRIQDLVVQREAFENSQLARTNESLYGFIKESLSLYRDLTEGEDLKAKKLGLHDYLNLKGYGFKSTSPLSLKVIRCVFGDKDRRRISTYHTVLRVAIAEKWDLNEVATKISARGGVQEISVRKANAMSQKDKALTAQSVLLNQSIASIDSQSLKSKHNSEFNEQQAVAVLTQNTDGTYSVHCVVHSSTAVNAALAAYFSANKSDIQQIVEQQKLTEANSQQASLIANAVNAANDTQSQAAA